MGRGDRHVYPLSPILITHTTGGLVHVFHPSSHWACNIIFSHTDPDVLFGEAARQTVRLSLADGSSSVTEFSGYSGSHDCHGDAMALNGTVLYVGYSAAECVVAYDTVTLQLLWTTCVAGRVCSLTHHNGLLFVTVRDTPTVLLSAEDGSVVRTLPAIPGEALGISVFAGWFVMC